MIEGQKKTNAEIVLEAIQDIHAQEQVVTREVIMEHTGLKLTVIDDRVGYLIDNGLVYRVQRGVFVPAPGHGPARIITKTLLPCGTVKLEIGDDHVLTLTPRENRMLGELMAGAGQQFSGIEAGRQAVEVSGELAQQIKRLRREVATVRGVVSAAAKREGEAAEADTLAG